MRCAVVSGSLRTASNSARIGRYLAARWELTDGCFADLVDLGTQPLPMWDERASAGDATFLVPWRPVEAVLDAAQCLVLISPEYGGMASPAVRNFLLYLHPGLVAHKPLLLVGVSHGSGGSYPIAELRAGLHKNTHLCPIPEQLIFRDLGPVDGDRSDPGAQPTWMEARVDFSLEVLRRYAVALSPVRTELSELQAEFPFGM